MDNPTYAWTSHIIERCERRRRTKELGTLWRLLKWVGSKYRYGNNRNDLNLNTKRSKLSSLYQCFHMQIVENRTWASIWEWIINWIITNVLLSQFDKMTKRLVPRFKSGYNFESLRRFYVQYLNKLALKMTLLSFTNNLWKTLELILLIFSLKLFLTCQIVYWAVDWCEESIGQDIFQASKHWLRNLKQI